MTPKRYFDEIVRPTYEEFRAHPTSVRHALIACTMTYHVVDAIFVYRKSPKGVGGPRGIAEAEMFPKCHSLRQIDAVAHATKHIELDKRHDNSETPRLNISEIRIGRGAAFSDGSYFSDGSTFSDAPNVPIIDRGEDKWDMRHTLEDAIEFLAQFTANMN